MGRMGLSEAELEERHRRRRTKLIELREALLAKRRGRPRGLVSDYALPRAGLQVFRDSVRPAAVPFWLCAAAKKLATARLTGRRGPPLYTGTALARHIANGGHDPRNLLRYQKRLETEQLEAEEMEAALDAERCKPEPPQHVIGMWAAMRRF